MRGGITLSYFSTIDSFTPTIKTIARRIHKYQIYYLRLRICTQTCNPDSGEFGGFSARVYSDVISALTLNSWLVIAVILNRIPSERYTTLNSNVRSILLDFTQAYHALPIQKRADRSVQCHGILRCERRVHGECLRGKIRDAAKPPAMPRYNQ